MTGEFWIAFKRSHCQAVLMALGGSMEQAALSALQYEIEGDDYDVDVGFSLCRVSERVFNSLRAEWRGGMEVVLIPALFPEDVEAPGGARVWDLPQVVEGARYFGEGAGPLPAAFGRLRRGAR